MTRSVSIILGLLCLVATAQAASFDCTKAQTKIEHLICDNPKISSLDELLATIYRDALSKADGAERLRVTLDQKVWLKSTRNACADSQCLELTYRSRIAEIEIFSSSRSTLYIKKSAEQISVCRDVMDAVNRGTLDTLIVPEDDLAQVDINSDGIPERVDLHAGNSLEIFDRSGDQITLTTSEEDDWESDSLSGENTISIVRHKKKFYILGQADGQLSYLAQLDRKNMKKVICEYGLRNDGGKAMNYILSEYERVVRNAASNRMDPWTYVLASKGHFGLLVLLDAKHDFHLNKISNGFDSAVHEAIQLNKIDALRLMLEHGANPNAPDGKLNMAPIYVARQGRNKAVVDLLIKFGADPTYRDWTGPIAKFKWQPLAKQEFVSIFAGGDSESGSVDGLGTVARFKAPHSLVVYGGNLYVADCANAVVRKIELATGSVTTFAGVAGKEGDADGLGRDARFSKVFGIATDGVNLYVTDNHAIRKIVIATREVITLAGEAGASGSTDGIGKAARFSGPMGIATDGANLYVADGHVVRKVVIATGAVFTLAGNAVESGKTDGIGATARFFMLQGIATDGSFVYVSDNYYAHVRKISVATGAVTTLAGPDADVCATGFRSRCPKGSAIDGNGIVARFDSPFYLALDGNKLYVADRRYIRRITVTTGEVQTLSAGQFVKQVSGDNTKLTTFNNLMGITMDATTMYVGDNLQHSIYKIRKPK